MSSKKEEFWKNYKYPIIFIIISIIGFIVSSQEIILIINDFFKSIFKTIAYVFLVSFIVVLTLKPFKFSTYFNNETSRTIREWFNKYLPFIFITISLLAIFVPNSGLINISDDIGDRIEKIGYVALTSGVFAGILKSIQFTGIFREEIEKIVLSSDYLKEKRNLGPLWKSVSKEMYTRRFPNVSDDLEDVILDSYLSNEKNHYNKDVEITIIIEEINTDWEITYTQEIKYLAILAENENESSVSYKSNISKITESSAPTQEIVFYKIDNEDINCKKIRKEQVEEQNILFTHKSILKGNNSKREFLINHKFKNKYSLKTENHKLLRFGNITKGVDISVTFPDNIEVAFFNVGLIKPFQKHHEDVKNSLTRTHRDHIILPRQGFGMSFNKK
jgi:hypothetical protein